ncbi:TPA: NIPSNAP family protein [Pseudomonas aeruginosa]|uniref:NIPSNAP family protein n=1 Tax=Pseudomonas TaxID=286 RepID=UPI000D20C400|nr:MULTISPECIES: NIPSNAP family protein [Pseudomonas]AVZ17501.1 NIPSNAP family protein [Pseudomonas aeruginosa]HBO3287463.1 NIPSNAP family protein [Pseudomonas aeruginosa]HCR1733537.1 NIPSNAP family protein [Pseudomonas aeruginosa]HDU9072273.1 NIPSNAP family protein [Pseudomonas aeruginosa]HDU9135466.1 NIPSNAP family protein [Pseudomonas aeruginosa]
MIIEERIYRIKSGSMSSYLELVRDEGLAIQRPILGRLVGYFTTEIGVLSQITHMWAYASLEDRANRRRQLAEDPRWQAFIPRLAQFIEHAENRILTPADFSPLPEFSNYPITNQETQL